MSCKTWSMNLWNFYVEFFRPNGIRRYSKSPNGVMIAIFSLASGAIVILDIDPFLSCSSVINNLHKVSMIHLLWEPCVEVMPKMIVKVWQPSYLATFCIQHLHTLISLESWQWGESPEPGHAGLCRSGCCHLAHVAEAIWSNLAANSWRAPHWDCRMERIKEIFQMKFESNHQCFLNCSFSIILWFNCYFPPVNFSQAPVANKLKFRLKPSFSLVYLLLFFWKKTLFATISFLHWHFLQQNCHIKQKMI